MSGNVLWTPLYNKPDSQSQELTRQHIRQHSRVGRRPAETTPGPEFQKIIRGEGATVLVDPWAQTASASAGQRHTLAPPIPGYGGTIPLVRPEHTGANRGESAAHFVPHIGSAAHARARATKPGGGAGSLGTAPAKLHGSRTLHPRGIYESHVLAVQADPLHEKA